MKVFSRREIDKTNWPKGRWIKEVDRRQWFCLARLPCLIVRHPDLGHLSGYVGVPPSHPYHRRPVDCNCRTKNGELVTVSKVIGHHSREITYADIDGSGRHPISFEFEEWDEQNLWLFGFDCAATGEIAPALGSRSGDEYRHLGYVTFETVRLASVLSSVETLPKVVDGQEKATWELEPYDRIN